MSAFYQRAEPIRVESDDRQQPVQTQVHAPCDHRRQQGVDPSIARFMTEPSMIDTTKSNADPLPIHPDATVTLVSGPDTLAHAS
jgi:hypothetical protein